MKTITLTLQAHKGTDRIFASFDYDTELVKLVKTIPGAKYSATKKAWHLPVDKDLVLKLIELTSKIAVVDTNQLREQLIARKSTEAVQQQYDSKSGVEHLSNQNRRALQKFIETLTLKQYSPSTIKTYHNEFFQLLKELREMCVDDLQIEHIRRYMHYCFERYKLSEATANSRINAIKFYYEQVLGREKMFVELPRPKMPMKLPKVLGEKELRRLFMALPNLKHKAILFTAYSAGLRVSEVVNLKLSDVDSDRMQLFIERAKGKKDRYVTLSPILLDILRSYIKDNKPRPIKYVFEGLQPGLAYSARSAQRLFQMAKDMAGIKKEVSFHVLRHSFATHLLEKGIDAIYIRDILGHFNLKTTQRYLHVRKEHLVNIVSPLDDLWKKEHINISQISIGDTTTLKSE